jgi:hypothetical protein
MHGVHDCAGALQRLPLKSQRQGSIPAGPSALTEAQKAMGRLGEPGRALATTSTPMGTNLLAARVCELITTMLLFWIA